MSASANDPYRPPADSSARRVIARRSNGALAFHLLLSLLGLATPVAVMKWGEDVPALFVLAFLAVPTGLLGFGRTVHAWFLPHSIELDQNGMRFAWAEKITAMPCLRARDCELSWSELSGIRTHTFSVNGISSTELIVSTTNGTVSVPDDHFDRSAHLIQRDILDFLDLQRERPVGASSEFARRCRERFATPERLVAKPWGVIGSTLLFAPFIAFPIWLADATPFWLTYGLAALSAGIFGWLIVSGLTQWLRDRMLVLRSDGLGIGRSEARLRLIPWDEIRLVRRDLVNGKIESIEVVVQDGTRTTLRQNYGRTLDDIAGVIDPAAD
jgi:hypothetical protein